MALINCDECGNKVSDKAKCCPNCGNPITKSVLKNNVINNDNNSNIFSKLALITVIVLLAIPNLKILSILFIVPFILAILGMIKSDTIKKNVGKGKGFFISVIVCIVASLGLLFFVDTCLFTNSTVNNTQDLSNRDKIIYNQVKNLKQSLHNPESFKLFSVSVYSNKESRNNSFNVLVDYSGENLMGGTTRSYIIFKYTSAEGDNNKNIIYRLYEEESDWNKAQEEAKDSVYTTSNELYKQEDLNVNSILNYINN